MLSAVLSVSLYPALPRPANGHPSWALPTASLSVSPHSTKPVDGGGKEPAGTGAEQGHRQKEQGPPPTHTHTHTPQLILYSQYLILCVPKVVKGNLRFCVYQGD